MVIASFKRAHDLCTLKIHPLLFNEPPTTEHLHHLFFDTIFGKYLINTVVVGIAILLTYFVPPTLLFIQLSRLIAVLGLQESLWSLILIYPIFTIPSCTWLLRCFLTSIPLDIEEQALLDGHSRAGADVNRPHSIF